MVVSHIKGNSLILIALPMTGMYFYFFCCPPLNGCFLLADDIDNQRAVALAREADPKGERTIGLSLGFICVSTYAQEADVLLRQECSQSQTSLEKDPSLKTYSWISSRVASALSDMATIVLDSLTIASERAVLHLIKPDNTRLSSFVPLRRGRRLRSSSDSVSRTSYPPSVLCCCRLSSKRKCQPSTDRFSI